MPGSLAKFDTRWSNKPGYHYIIPTAKIFGYLCSHMVLELGGNLLLQLVWRRIILRLRSMDGFSWNEGMLVGTKRNSLGLVWTEDVQVQVISRKVISVSVLLETNLAGRNVIDSMVRRDCLCSCVESLWTGNQNMVHVFFLDYKEDCFMVNLFMNLFLGVRLEDAAASARWCQFIWELMELLL